MVNFGVRVRRRASSYFNSARDLTSSWCWKHNNSFSFSVSRLHYDSEVKHMRRHTTKHNTKLKLKLRLKPPSSRSIFYSTITLCNFNLKIIFFFVFCITNAGKSSQCIVFHTTLKKFINDEVEVEAEAEALVVFSALM